MPMESNFIEESANSSEEPNKGENFDLGVGRSYECVYCKRGFNTAQALGGHMNIHRKDRVKKKPDTSNDSKKHEEIYTGPRLCQQLPARSYNCQSDSFAPHDHQPILMKYATYLPASTSSTRSPLDGSDGNYQRPLNSIPDDWHMGLSLEFSTKEDMEMNGSGVLMNQNEELDLELRLGYI